jgi:succinoglycan biosynthesis protein ExoM
VEIVVVDNDPAMSAKASCDDFRARHPEVELRYVLDTGPGVAAARNRCLMEATGEWVTFIDDDEYVDAAWLVELIQVQEEYHADAVLGPVLPAFAGTAPVPRDLIGAYMRTRHRTGGVIGWREARTGNVLLRRSLVKRVGLFDPSFGPTGGEDTAFFAMAWRAGAKLVWADRAIVFETTGPERMSRRWLCRRSFNGARSYVRVLARVHGRWAGAMELAKGAIGLPVHAMLFLLAIGTGSPTRLQWSLKLCESWGKLLALRAIDGSYEDR